MKLFPILLFISCSLAVTACSETINIDSKNKQLKIKHICKPLHEAVEKGEIKVVKKLIKTIAKENQLACIQYAMQQTFPYGGSNQFLAFRYLVEELIRMKLPNQQTILNNILQDYVIIYLSANPSYTEYLLRVGALPKTPNKSGWFPVSNALWTVNDYGSCKTPRLLINASNPEILSMQNKAGETTLMQSIKTGDSCPDELKLLANKSAGLNLVDQNGNTALHYLLVKMKGYIDPVRQKQPHQADLEVLRILLKRGASTKISNKKSITPAQLLRELKSQGCKCWKY